MDDVDRGLADEVWAQLSALADRRRQDRSLLTHLELLVAQSPGDSKLRRKAEMWRRTVDAQDAEVMKLDMRVVEAVTAARHQELRKAPAPALIECFRVVFAEMEARKLSDLGETDFAAQVRLCAALSTYLPARPGHWSNPPLRERRSPGARTPAAVVALQTIAAVLRQEADALDRVAASVDYAGHHTARKRADLHRLRDTLAVHGPEKAAQAAASAFAGIGTPHIRLLPALGDGTDS